MSEATIESALVGALPIPIWEWPKEAASVRKALQKADYAKALEAALAMKEGAAYVDTVKAVIQGRLDGLVAAFDEGDFLSASESGTALRKAFKGLPELAKVEEILTRIKEDKDAQTIIKAQEAVLELAAEAEELTKKKDAEKLLDELRKIQQKSAGTFAAKQAGELADLVRKKLPGLQ